MTNKNIGIVLFEALFIGIILVVIVNIVKSTILQYIPNFSGNKINIELLLISGIIFHLLFEYTGLNKWYSIQYCKLL